MLPVKRALHITAAMVGLLLLALATGCGSRGQVELTAADDGRQIELEVGQMLVVTLQANPSTGYRWDWVPSETGILQQSGEAGFEEGDTKGLVGAAERQVLRFTTMQAGTAELELVYHRPWEADAKPEGVFAVTVVVR